jgi:hypothetical protein
VIAGTMDFTTGQVALTWNTNPGKNLVAVIPTALPLSTIPLIFSAGGKDQTFFGIETSKLVGIQLLPLSGASYYLGGLNQDISKNSAFIDANVAAALYSPTQVGQVPIELPVYLTMVYSYQALSNPDQAVQNYLR